MPAEEWIEKCADIWTNMCVREMNQLAETQKRSSDALAANQQRMEDKHEARMQKIEESIDAMKTQNAAEFGKVYDKLDQTYTKLDEFIKASNEKSINTSVEQAILINGIKIKIGAISAGIGILTAATASWIFNLVR